MALHSPDGSHSPQIIMKYSAALLFVLVSSGLASFQCPKKDGQYSDEKYCDKFYVCKEGVAEEQLCPDGLVFDQTKRQINKCDYPYNVDCEDRDEIFQEAQSSEMCPRKNGFFAHPNPTNCHTFTTCINGEAQLNVCPPGLVFSEDIGVCTWPSSAGRTGCLREEKLDDGFKCPEEKQLDRNGNPEAHPRYPHPTDCQKFYICLNGVTPREHGCELGEVFNIENNQCDAPENVADCEDWYKDDPKVGGKKEVGERIVFKST